MSKSGLLVVLLLFSISGKESLAGPLDSVQLRNGVKMPRIAVNVTMMRLKPLIESDYEAFRALVEKSRNPDYQIQAAELEKLSDMALIDADGTVQSTVRDVVLSAAVGEGSAIDLQSPVASAREEKLGPVTDKVNRMSEAELSATPPDAAADMLRSLLAEHDQAHPKARPNELPRRGFPHR
jgi:hypothetical protein